MGLVLGQLGRCSDRELQGDGVIEAHVGVAQYMQFHLVGACWIEFELVALE